MALRITDTEITSDEIGTRAAFRQHAAADGNGAWVVYAVPYAGRLFDRNQAITAMTIAEEKARPAPNQALIASLQAELGIKARAAEAQAEAERTAELCEPEWDSADSQAHIEAQEIDQPEAGSPS
jgi:hypothetical protein